MMVLQLAARGDKIDDPVCADRSVVVGGSVSGATVTNRITARTATSGPCVNTSKE